VKRFTFTLDKRGFIHRICADEAVEVYIVDPRARRDRVYRWSSTKVGREHIDEEIAGWPASRSATGTTSRPLSGPRLSRATAGPVPPPENSEAVDPQAGEDEAVVRGALAISIVVGAVAERRSQMLRSTRHRVLRTATFVVTCRARSAIGRATVPTAAGKRRARAARSGSAATAASRRSRMLPGIVPPSALSRRGAPRVRCHPSGAGRGR
jgi:hypothetical protein